MLLQRSSNVLGCIIIIMLRLLLLVTGMSAGRQLLVREASAGTWRRDLLLFRESPRDGPSASIIDRAA